MTIPAMPLRRLTLTSLSTHFSWYMQLPPLVASCASWFLVDGRLLLQVEAFTQFFLGYYEEDMTYQDDFVVSLKRNLSSISGFWFDCVTSIPWSYMDLHFYLVLSCTLSCLLQHSCSFNPDACYIGHAGMHCRSGFCRDDKQQCKGDTGGEDSPHFAGRKDPEARQIRNVTTPTAFEGH